MAIKRTIAALLLTSGLAVSAAALFVTSAHADAYPWWGCKSADLLGASTVADALAVGGGECKAFGGAPTQGATAAQESMIIAPSRHNKGMYTVHACKAAVAGAIGDHTVKGTVCDSLDMEAETLRLIVGDADFNKAFSN